MPATRSRTENWRSLLDTVAERGGALELSVERPAEPGAEPRPDLVWRVRLLRINESDILVECPSAAGTSLRLRPETPVLVALSVGQNRWMFHSTVLGGWAGPLPGSGHRVETIALSMPERVERCSRRAFFRISTGSMNLASVRCWPLLDPTSAVAAEQANQRAFASAAARHGHAGLTLRPAELDEPAASMPHVGPGFTAQLLNISGGGLGLILPPGDNPFNRHKFFYLSLDLRPDLPEPVTLTARVAHSHLDSHQHTHAGLAFDFTFHPAHQRFVTDALTGYLNDLQRRGEPRTPPGVQAA